MPRLGEDEFQIVANCRRVKLAALGERVGKVAHEGAVHTGVPKGENALHYAWSLSIHIFFFQRTS